ncbi:hypothetical protein NC651_020156 [Populus alba x Populus x berolinensis]|nr:hypothetical protein NC651_020156 [Populus alba x Populus x berolinensis]
MTISDHTRQEEEERGEEEIDMGLIDFQFDDALGSSFYHSPFDIAQEMMEPMEQEHHGDEPPMIGEIMKRWKHERKFSASLYAYNGVSECLRLAFRPGMPAVANGGYEWPSNLGINSNNNEEEKRRDDMGKDAKEEVQEEVEIPQKPTEKVQEKKKTPLPPQVQSDMYNTFVPYSGPRIKTPSSSCYPLLPLNFFEIDSGPSSKPCANNRSLHHRFFDVTWIRFILLALHALLSLFVTYLGGLSCP